MTVSRTVSTGTSSGTLRVGSSTGISEHSQCSGRERGGSKPGTVSVIPENHTGITDTVPGFVPDDRRTGVRAGRGSGQGDPRGTLSRAAARDSVRAEGPVRHQGDSHDVRRGALPDAGAG